MRTLNIEGKIVLVTKKTANEGDVVLDIYNALMDILGTPVGQGAVYSETANRLDLIRMIHKAHKEWVATNSPADSLPVVNLEKAEHETLVKAINAFRWGIIDPAIDDWKKEIENLIDGKKE